jgi:Domain of unknown function (DUF362)
MKELSRRGMLQGALALLAGSTVSRSQAAFAAGASKSRVVLVRDMRAVDGDGRIRPGVVQDMIDVAVSEIVGETDPVDAWAQIVARHDVVGIKTNAWASLPTPAAVEQAIRRRVLDVGVGAADVALDDRGVLANGVFRRATALLNTRPMRTHHWAGLGTCIKNYIMFSPEPSSCHPNACEALGALWRLPQVRGKTRLNVLVMLTPQFHGAGPHAFSREHVWPYAGLVVSRDPVAADAVGAAIIAAKRRDFFGENRPISPSLRHIEVADRRFGLGNSRMERIDLLRVGDSGGSLI